MSKNWKDIFQSRGVTAAIIILGCVIVLLVVFRLGIAFGYQRALFASRWGESYRENFLGPRGIPAGFDGQSMMDTHNAFGKILKIDGETITLRDEDGNERSVVVSSSTPIMEFKNSLKISNLKEGEVVAVIGEPNGKGQISAKLVRVLPQPGAYIQATTSSARATNNS